MNVADGVQGSGQSSLENNGFKINRLCKKHSVAPALFCTTGIRTLAFCTTRAFWHSRRVMLLSGGRTRHHPKPRPVITGGQSGNLLECRTKRPRILISHGPGDVIDGAVGEFEHFPGLADSQVLAVLRRLKPGCRTESP